MAKICCKCKIEKSPSEFYKSSSRGFQSYCKSCQKRIYSQWLKRNPHKQQEYDVKGREKARNGHLKRNYGITSKQYEEMLVKQGGVCVICQEAPNVRGLVVDHDHKSGQVRGLLCLKCNSSIERMDSIYGWSVLAEAYLETAPNLWDA